ncbi:AAA domain-containing protein [Heracleum sosnowskyi]|uniref:AAA domain-containing protein n=1 Tax=Heracleum sosnowskyi TaxID=360622 RepID=A0AAD8HVC1_9APIA|nr:AAA domain-containing protein [Heracleum sosnowskyi]
MEFTMSSLFSVYASLSSLLMLIRTVANDIIPTPVRSYLESVLQYLFHRFTPALSQSTTIVVDDYSGINRNEIFESAEIYLRSKISPATDRFKVHKTRRQNNINLGIEKDIEMIDKFQGFELTWKFVFPEERKHSGSDKYFELSFDKKFKKIVLKEYFPFVLEKAKEIKAQDKVVRLYTRDFVHSYGDDEEGSSEWGSVNLEHPSTFDTLAMDPEMKQSVIDDLERFVRRKEYYKKVGKAWKRGYLLYGPPGTGKSSLVAAMANYLRFDIYDLELTSMYSNSELRRVLLSTTNRSIVLIEDIDCSAQMKDRDSDGDYDNSTSKLTLSGMLNFIDGLWSTCGDERIIVFTTNHKDKLDPALLRPGRMDMHIHMSYCTYNGFKVLARNYLGCQGHRLFRQIEDLMGKVTVTPAELAEELMKSELVDAALDGVIRFLTNKLELADKDDVEDTQVEESKVVKKTSRASKLFRKFVRSSSKTSFLVQ